MLCQFVTNSQDGSDMLKECFTNYPVDHVFYSGLLDLPEGTRWEIIVVTAFGEERIAGIVHAVVSVCGCSVTTRDHNSTMIRLKQLDLLKDKRS